MVHARLEGSWRIGRPKRHQKELIIPIVTSKSYHVHVLLSHSNLMVSRAQFNFGEVYCTMQLI